ncbi:glycosyltransferase family 2 protein [Flavisolibacter nicotianae]|uniref:glycosyltransferase family 2 protein n=1 Tax=Flavisolibacter nicotianae TaxID=2364882 RepID=UPI000EAE5CD6|nr:glycosyltransferase family A protein [Flavisolibacter nicotianae]
MSNQIPFSVSVVVPIYNADKYLEEAVESVVHLSETGEVILVDDASTDNSLALCRQLEKKYSKVKVLVQPDGKNRGAAAARNIGIIEALCEFIAFLDADDLYLPNRFQAEKAIFLSNLGVDGVYGCNLAVFENDSAREKFFKRYESEKTTLQKEVAPEDLFKVLLFGGLGRFHTSAITLRKRAFGKAGLFNTNIRYVEDTELWLKLSLTTTLVAGSIDEPVAIRRVHDNNSIHQVEKVVQASRQMYQALFDWAVRQPFQFDVKNSFFICLHDFVWGKDFGVKKLFWQQTVRNPSILLSAFFYKKIHQLYFIPV